MAAENAPFDPYNSICYIQQSYDTADSHASALSLILSLRPEWRDSQDTIQFVRFTDGITNTVCRCLPRHHMSVADIVALAHEGCQQQAGPFQDRRGS